MEASASQTFTARWLWPGPGRPRENWQVTLRDGRVSAVGPRRLGQPAHDLGEGLLLPGLVNAHCHLELAGLAGLLPPDGDFVGWVQRLVRLRPSQDPARAARQTADAAGQMARCGVALVADITNTGLARQALFAAGLHAISLFEALGPSNCQPPPPELTWQDGRLAAQGVAAHAPYSVPGPRIAALKALAGRQAFSIHLAESIAEMELFAGDGPQGRRLAEFLFGRGADVAGLGLLARRPLAHLRALGVLDRRTLLVHGAQLSPDEVRELAADGPSLCLCPRSNLGLTKTMAPAPLLLAAGVNLCLGSDSPASTPDLNLWNEIKALAEHYPGLDPEAILEMATGGGARALGLAGSFGRLAEGMRAPLCFAPLDGRPELKHVLEAVVLAAGPAAARAIGNEKIS